MRAPDGGDIPSVAGSGQPGINGGPDPPTLDGRFARAMMTGDQEDHSIAGSDRPVELGVDCLPCAVEVQSVKIDDAVRLDGTRSQALVPAAVQRCSRVRGRLSLLRRYGPFRRNATSRRGSSLRRRFFVRDAGSYELSRKRPDRGGHPCPERVLVRAERAHERRHPSVEGSAPGPMPTFRPQPASHPGRRPSKCRNGLRP